MVLNYNGTENYTDMITFTGVPNIVSILSDLITGSKCTLKIIVNDLTQVVRGKIYTISINDVTITSGSPGNKKFFISDNNNDKTAVAYSIAKALRNAGLVNFDIFQEAPNGILSNTVVIRAKEIGSPYVIRYLTNMDNITTYTFELGTSTDEFLGGKLNIDVYSGNDYITTLEKNYYKNYIDFNISDVLKSITPTGAMVPYTLNIYSEYNNRIRNLGLIKCKSVNGYMCNQGKPFINEFPTVALNFSRGESREFLNNTILYTYLPIIPFSAYITPGKAFAISVDYLDSAKLKFAETPVDVLFYGNSCRTTITLNKAFFDLAYYVDIVLDGVGKIRYNVIKPINATSKCLRVYYHNSYGGTSFFDFTGKITENHKVDNETFTKNLYNYYRDDTKEQIKIYEKETSIVVTMKSHLMEKDAIWQFNDLLNSSDVWTTINGVDYKIIITDCKTEETETGVWEASITYTYSLI